MALLKSTLWLVLALTLAISCGKKKKTILSADELSDVSDFIAFFADVAPPFKLTDSVFRKKDKDSLLISSKVFRQFVPDTVLAKIFGKGAKPKIVAAGKVTEPGAGYYLFVKAIAAEKKALLVLAYDKDEKFITSMMALRPDNSPQTAQSVVLDKSFTITRNVIKKNADGSTNDGKDVYVLNAAAGTFTLIMTDALDEKITELINPIDTFTRKHKYAADYGSGKMNLVSVRDGKKPDRVLFFIHFEKDNGNCTGELKGEALWKSANTAEYKESGDPCSMKFTFSNTSVTIAEENCGSRRTSLNCSFNGSFARKKYIKPAATKSTKPVDKKSTVKK